MKRSPYRDTSVTDPALPIMASHLSYNTQLYSTKAQWLLIFHCSKLFMNSTYTCLTYTDKYYFCRIFDNSLQCLTFLVPPPGLCLALSSEPTLDSFFHSSFLLSICGATVKSKKKQKNHTQPYRESSRQEAQYSDNKLTMQGGWTHQKSVT